MKKSLQNIMYYIGSIYVLLLDPVCEKENALKTFGRKYKQNMVVS